jgi:hypothetical protein
MKKTQLVFVPAPGFGHLVSAVQLAKMVLERNDSFLITMLAINNPFYGGISKNTESLASIHTEIRFVEIPDTIPTPPPEALAVSPASAFTSYINDHKTLVKDTIVNLVMAPPTLHQLLVLLLICFALPLLMLQKNLGSLLVFCKKLLKLPCLVCINHKFDLENWKP